MLTRRQFITALCAFAGIPAVLTCTSKNIPPLTIASHVWPGYELMFLARKEGWPPTPQELTLVETDSATASLNALFEGKVIGAALTLDEMLRARDQGLSLTAVLVFDVSAGADMLLAKPGIETLTDLMGKRVGVEQSAVGALMLEKALQASHLSASDIIKVPARIDEHVSAWQEDRVDALITYAPVATQLLEKDANRLFDSRDIPDTIFDVLAIKSEFLQTYAETLGKLIGSHFKARDHLIHNPQDASYRLASRLGLLGPEVLASYQGLELPDIKNNRKFLATPNGDLLTAAKNLSSLMVSAGFLSQQLSLDNLVSAEFLPEDI
ncbi:MAG: ABC transporter substrate-binding protein [Methylobacter sp.]|nr:ABC transporter substrate-binding protein [Methylococcales bacterium]MDD5112668.1 ABC transporter substrate-binding protein [Methylobacter sp.]